MIDYGPFWLSDAESGHHIWAHGLPLEGIADALDCFERELVLAPGEDFGKAWGTFGAGWAPGA